MAKPRKPRVEWERMLLSEYIARRYPRRPYLIQFRVGAPHPALVRPDLAPEEVRMLLVFARRADGLVIFPDRLILIEAALKADPGHIEKLQLYERLLPYTPGLEEHRHKPIEKELVYIVPDPVIISMARERDIRCINYVPTWYKEYLATLAPRHRIPGKYTYPK